MTDDSADPRHYFHLLLQRLLETQQCLHKAPLSQDLKTQRTINDSTLSEIKSWLEATADSWEIIPSPSSARIRVTSGDESSSPAPRPGDSPWDILKPRSGRVETAPGPSPVLLSQDGQERILTVQRTSTGRIVFRQNSGPAKPDSISDGTSMK